ncbi:MAG: DUF2726 domain-containing protein [Acidaminobacteraceae bacterium]
MNEYSPKLLKKRKQLDKLEKLEKQSNGISRFKSENIMMLVLDNVLIEDVFNSIGYESQVYLKHIFKDLDRLNDEEKKYIKHNSSVDFLIINKFDNMPLAAIEVDGYKYHENNEEQKKRDIKKNSIFKKFNLNLHRFSTTEQLTDEMLKNILMKYVE